MIYFLDPIALLPPGAPRGFNHPGVWFETDAFPYQRDEIPYQTIAFIQRFGPSFLLMVLSFFIGCILVFFSKRLSKEFDSMAQITTQKRSRFLSIAEATVAFYSLILFLVCSIFEYNFSMKFYGGRDILLLYEMLIGIIALVSFRLAKGTRFRWLALFSGIGLIFWVMLPRF
jgi:uncharacterized membrane protein